MARPRMVTRSFKRTNVKFLAFNETKNQGQEHTFKILGAFKDSKEILTALRDQYDGPDVPIKVLSSKVESCILGMRELDFYRNAVEILDQNTNKIKETKQVKTTPKKKGK